MLQTTTPTKADTIPCCRHGVPLHVRGHDCNYTDLRASLVPSAERYADAKAGPRPAMQHGATGKASPNPAYEAWTRAWNVIFFAFIDAEVKKLLQEQRP